MSAFFILPRHPYSRAERMSYTMVELLTLRYRSRSLTILPKDLKDWWMLIYRNLCRRAQTKAIGGAQCIKDIACFYYNGKSILESQLESRSTRRGAQFASQNMSTNKVGSRTASPIRPQASIPIKPSFPVRALFYYPLGLLVVNTISFQEFQPIA